MSTLKFDVPAPTPPAILDAAITSVDVVDLDGNPNRVVEAGAGFNVPVRWDLTGVLAPLVINDWHVRLFAESIGGGFEGKLAEVTAAVPTLISPTHVRYDATLIVPAATTNLLVNAEGDGVYELVVVIAHDNVVNARDTMAGFADGLVIEVRKP
jgi:hypothetical protein